MIIKKSDYRKESKPISMYDKEPHLNILNLFLTSDCTCRCPFCHIWGKNGWAPKTKTADIFSKSEIDYHALVSFLKEIKNRHDNVSVRLTGGEPTLYLKFPELLQFIHSLDFTSQVLTNGFSLTEYWHLLVKYTDYLYISLDAPGEAHDRLRGRKNLFRDIMKGLEKIVAYKIERNTPLPFVIINCVLSEQNQHTFHQLVEELDKNVSAYGGEITLSLDYQSLLDPKKIGISFQTLLFTTKEKGALYAETMKKQFDIDIGEMWKGFLIDFSKMDIPLLKKKLWMLWEKYNIDRDIFIDIEKYYLDINELFGYEQCQAPWNELRVRPSGDLYTCPDIADFSIGNMYNNTFDEIWYGERIKNFREFISKGLHGLCNRCCRLFNNYNHSAKINHYVLMMKKHLSSL